MPQTRQLAAIMFTDIQGYTAMMQRDEALAIKIRERHRKIFNSTTENFNGKILQYFGDGTLSTFKSAIDAVKCAMEMQTAFQKEPVIPVRIGIHLGDIVITEDDIIGDGVNVASRIESLAVPGSVFISDKVYDEIKNQSSIETQSLKTFELKNVDKPIEVFAISNKGLIIPNVEDISGKTKEKQPYPKQLFDKDTQKVRKYGKSIFLYSIIGLLVLLTGYFIYQNIFKSDFKAKELNKSIAVLPFVNMTNDPDQEYFSDGITEDILTHLSKIADLRVVSRTSTLQYKNTTKTIPQIGRELGVTTVLEGSVRKYKNQVRITAQLIDAATDVHIWAETYDREMTKIFEIQTEVAKEILKVLKAKLTPREEKSLANSPTSEITAYDYYLRGMELLDKGETQKEYQNAALFFHQAIEEDPKFAAAYVGLAWTLVATRSYGSSEEIWKDSSYALNQKALTLDTDLDEAYFFNGMIYMHEGELQEAINQFERTLQLNPNHERAIIMLGESYLELKQFDKGLEFIVDGLLRQLNRKDPEFYLRIGQVYLEIAEYDKAKQFLNRAITLKPDYYRAYYMLVEVCFIEKNFPDALLYAKKTVEIEKNVHSLDRLAWTYLLIHDYNAAIEVWRELGELQSEFDDTYFAVAYKHRLAYVLWQSGEKEEAKILFEEQISQNLDVLENEIKTDVVGEAYDLAGIYAFLGDEDEALKWIQVSADQGFLPVGLIDRDPLFNNIRHNVQFKKLIDKQRKEDENLRPKFQKAKKKIREMEEMGILNL